MNLKIKEMIVSINKYIESVDLPLEVKRMALKEIYDEIAIKADEAVRSEIATRDAAESEKVNESAVESKCNAIPSEMEG